MVCSNCQKINNLDSEPETERQLLLRYFDDIICTVNGKPDTLLRKVNTLHRKLEFTIEKPNENGNLAFLDMNININGCRKINYEWYEKPTDTGVVLNFRSYARIQHKKIIVEGTVHRVFRRTSIWQNVDKALRKMKKFGYEIKTLKVGLPR